jgi:predicted metal-dependent HD superfamily phosphohydrolase
MELKDTFCGLVMKYANDQDKAKMLWQEIEVKYSAKKRYYHNLAHLQHMLNVLEPVLNHIDDTDSLLFALFYHDFVYDATSKQNEENSAKAATERLQAIGFPTESIALCSQHIIATKKHEAVTNAATNLLLDADLSILGSTKEEYDAYCHNIRKEYSLYPDLVYKPGRAKVVRYFLEMDYIFKTEYFREMFESSAKNNLKRELAGI